MGSKDSVLVVDNVLYSPRQGAGQLDRRKITRGLRYLKRGIASSRNKLLVVYTYSGLQYVFAPVVSSHPNYEFEVIISNADRNNPMLETLKLFYYEADSARKKTKNLSENIMQKLGNLLEKHLE